MAKREVFECEQCKKLKTKIFIFEATVTKAVVNAPVFQPTSFRFEVCNQECFLKKVQKQTASIFEEKPIIKRAMGNNKKEDVINHGKKAD